jgi:hypothetical protein
MTTYTESMTVPALRAELRRLRDINAPFSERNAISDRIEQMERENPSPRAPSGPRACCDAGSIHYDCTCRYVVRCPVHGETHRGTHD